MSVREILIIFLQIEKPDKYCSGSPNTHWRFARKPKPTNLLVIPEKSFTMVPFLASSLSGGENSLRKPAKRYCEQLLTTTFFGGKMKIKSITLVAALCAVTTLTCRAYADEGAEKTKAAIKEQYPNVNIESVSESSIKGIYEVVAGQNIVYFHPGTKSLILGEIIQNGKSITAEKREKLVQQAVSSKLANFSYDKAIKLGNGPHKVIEVTDPDCPYCRKAFTDLKNRTDVTKYVIFAPLAHPQAITKCQYVIDAKDQQQAYDDMMSGKPLPDGFKPSEKAKKLSEEQLAIARDLGVTGTPTYFIEGSMVVGADTQKIEKLLGKQEIKATK